MDVNLVVVVAVVVVNDLRCVTMKVMKVMMDLLGNEAYLKKKPVEDYCPPLLLLLLLLVVIRREFSSWILMGNYYYLEVGDDVHREIDGGIGLAINEMIRY